MILFDDAAIIPFIESVSVSDYSSQKYNTGHSALRSALAQAYAAMMMT